MINKKQTRRWIVRDQHIYVTTNYKKLKELDVDVRLVFIDMEIFEEIGNND